MSKETVYSQVPHEMAVKWHEKGAERLHLVDLDGAVQGKPVNSKVIRSIVDAIPIPIQLGGGIRDIKTIETYLDLGIHQIILGTVAYRNPEFVSLACKKFPKKIIIGIDAKRGKVAVEGWTEKTDMTPEELAEKYEEMGISAIVYLVSAIIFYIVIGYISVISQLIGYVIMMMFLMLPAYLIFTKLTRSLFKKMFTKGMQEVPLITQESYNNQ